MTRNENAAPEATIAAEKQVEKEPRATESEWFEPVAAEAVQARPVELEIAEVQAGREEVAETEIVEVEAVPTGAIDAVVGGVERAEQPAGTFETKAAAEAETAQVEPMEKAHVESESVKGSAEAVREYEKVDKGLAEEFAEVVKPYGAKVEKTEPDSAPVGVDSAAVDSSAPGAPKTIEAEVIALDLVAGEVENQEEEEALTDSSPQSDAVAAKSEPVAEPEAPQHPGASAAEPATTEAAAANAETPAETELEPAPAQPAPPEAAPEPKVSAPAEAGMTGEKTPAEEKTAGEKTADKVAAMLKARGQDAEQSPFSVIVSQVYDGPLDLLLDLIRKQDIDIYDIPIASITAQFLAYVDRLRASDMDVAGDFIYTAALLIHIKSRMLLPRSPAGPDDAAEDPRRELVERLLEHERFKNAAQMLHERQMLEAASWSNPGVRDFREDEGAEPEIAADTTDLVRIFSNILERARNRPILDLQEDTVTVGQMIQFLARRLTMEDKPIALRRVLSHATSERALIAVFLALLEMVRLQAILLRQDRHFSEIFIKKHTGFEAAMNRGLAEVRDDWR